MGWPVQLFPNRQVTDEEAQRTVMKVAMYAYYLSHEYASATVERYVGDLQAFQAELCDGRRAEELGQHFFRVRVIIKVLKQRNPGKTHEKRPFLPQYFRQIVAGMGWDNCLTTVRDIPRMTANALKRCARYKKDAHQLFVGFGVATLAEEYAFRLAELVHTVVPSVTARHWMMVADWVFYAGSRRIRYLQDGRLDPRDKGAYTHCVSKVGPSKTDGVGGLLQVVSYVPIHPQHALFAWETVLWAMLSLNPVPRAFAVMMPVFTETPFRKGVSVEAFREASFWAAMRTMCRLAIPEIEYKGLGNHCFRVFAMNMAVKLGAGPMIVAALGRWQSDCFLLYGRDHTDALQALARKMVTAKASMVMGNPTNASNSVASRPGKGEKKLGSKGKRKRK